MMHSRKKWTSLSLALILALVGAVAATANFPNVPNEEPIAEVEVREGIVIWHPLINERLGLTISGPEGTKYKEFRGGETPYFKIVGEQGVRKDGSYTWRLVAMPELDENSPGGSANGRKWELDPEEVPKRFVQSGDFSVCDGFFADPKKVEEGSGVQAPADPNKDFVILDDLIVDGSACIGFDCVNGESFSFDTIRLKENNLRIKFQDTSVAASFPSTDWQLTANSSANGGANKFSIDDISGSRTPFTVEANAPTHSLYVDDGGRIGLGTSTPSTDIHAISGDTPTLRLQQDGSSGFAPQTWDVAGNETNFFIRDASNGSQLPFRIRPGAPTSSIFIDVDGDVGFGTASPDSSLHILDNGGTAKLHIEDSTATAGTYTLFELETSGGTNVRPRFAMIHSGAGTTWNFDILNGSGNFNITRGGGGPIFNFDATSGDLSIDGEFISNGTTLNVPDFVFADDYPLMPLEEVQAFIDEKSHLPEIPSAKEVQEGGLNITDMQLKLLQKVEELTLYALDQHRTNLEQQQIIQELTQRLESLEGSQN